MSETTFELRKLEAKDIAPMASILTKIGMKEFKDCFTADDLKGMTEDAEAVGMAIMFDIAGVILSNYEKAQTDIFKFLSSLSGMEVKAVEEMALETFAEMVIQVVQKEEFKSFFSVVSKLFK